MRAVVQRVAWAQVEVEGVVVGRIERGLLVLLGIARNDTLELNAQMLDKLLNLRIFPNDAGRFDLSLKDIAGAILVVSQFTLMADCRKGRRPNFQEAAPPEQARSIYDDFLQRLTLSGLASASGVFQEHMAVTSLNDGPVTLIIDLPQSE